MKKLQLQSFGLADLNVQEATSIQGGGNITSWLKKIGPVSIATWIITNWEDIKSGAKSAWEDYDNSSPH